MTPSFFRSSPSQKACKALQGVPALDGGEGATQGQGLLWGCDSAISLPGEANLLEQKSVSAEWVVIREYWSKKGVFLLLVFFTAGILFFPLWTESSLKTQLVKETRRATLFGLAPSSPLPPLLQLFTA